MISYISHRFTLKRVTSSSQLTRVIGHAEEKQVWLARRCSLQRGALGERRSARLSSGKSGLATIERSLGLRIGRLGD
jgi:hypothetical protein